MGKFEHAQWLVFLAENERRAAPLQNAPCLTTANRCLVIDKPSMNFNIDLVLRGSGYIVPRHKPPQGKYPSPPTTPHVDWMDSHGLSNCDTHPNPLLVYFHGDCSKDKGG